MNLDTLTFDELVELNKKVKSKINEKGNEKLRAFKETEDWKKIEPQVFKLKARIKTFENLKLKTKLQANLELTININLEEDYFKTGDIVSWTVDNLFRFEVSGKLVKDENMPKEQFAVLSDYLSTIDFSNDACDIDFFPGLYQELQDFILEATGVCSVLKESEIKFKDLLNS